MCGCTAFLGSLGVGNGDFYWTGTGDGGRHARKRNRAYLAEGRVCCLVGAKWTHLKWTKYISVSDIAVGATLALYMRNIWPERWERMRLGYIVVEEALSERYHDGAGCLSSLDQMPPMQE
ncbi:hypothetical protein DFH07DRAFT_771955 [Mycena maculata]|uniref:Uncharacterized protein n=1 Tax=Mycena maculata TaxID=230809 RepID=A0AAD7J9G5_9AGAR|nr:hypothetical protein DFH07DRAFT_771955 [Mycena maculata]